MPDGFPETTSRGCRIGVVIGAAMVVDRTEGNSMNRCLGHVWVINFMGIHQGKRFGQSPCSPGMALFVTVSQLIVQRALGFRWQEQSVGEETNLDRVLTHGGCARPLNGALRDRQHLGPAVL